ncbi:hypothetical protein [Sinorhizobium medicae]|uniref:hypothetical protein n=1 Tax=Sinorhizobium medicae TaxID=110321 RepID=UPI0013E355C2|nr:hypothetical protein [Sinorhizobium medicae]
MADKQTPVVQKGFGGRFAEAFDAATLGRKLINTVAGGYSASRRFVSLLTWIDERLFLH